MNHSSQRNGLLAAALFIAAPALADDTYRLSIPAQPLTKSLQTFAQQSGLTIVHHAQVTSNKTAPALEGEYTPSEALMKILADSGLQFSYVNARTVAIRPAAPAKSGTEQIGSRQDDSTTSVWRRLRLAQLDDSNSTPTGSAVPTGAGDGASAALEEIIVTAQKRSERLQDVPLPVTAISADTLLDRNQLRLQDYFSSITGLSFVPGGRGEPSIAIRGVTAEYGANPAVGIVVDDIPYGASTGLGGGYTAPDIDPSDLVRVEVLRGPQGTLYGASSLGGLVKFVTIDPSMDAMSGRVQVGASSVEGGDDLGYSVRGSINLPLGNNWAVRASGFTRRDPGYIDNVGFPRDAAHRKDDVNETEGGGGRLAALWAPSDNFSLKLGAFLQDSKLQGAPLVTRQPGFGDLQQSTLSDTGWLRRQTEIYSANITANLGTIDLVSISGYSVDQLESVLDYTPVLGAFLGPQSEDTLGTPNGTGITVPDERRTEKFTQEFRLSGPIGSRFEWLFGLFYTHESTPAEQNILAVDPVSSTPVGSWLDIPFKMKYEEYAAFADLTVNITDRFDVQVGGRQSRIEEKFTQVSSGPFIGGTAVQEGESSAEPFTYLLTPRFRVSPDLMLYARFAAGYRAGGPTTNAAVLGLPAQYDPDKTRSYEIGAKGTMGEQLSFDASIYYTQWLDIQLVVSEDGLAWIDNAGKAKSQGIELSMDCRPLDGLRISGWAAWNDAELTENFPESSTVLGVDGERIPYTSRLSGHLSIDEEFAMTNALTGFVGVSVSYVGDRKGVFTATGGRESYPSYARTDLRAGAKTDSWTVNLFVNNVADKRAALQGGIGSNDPNAFQYIQPRTVGMSLSKSF